jgi:hypothetical protein
MGGEAAGGRPVTNDRRRDPVAPLVEFKAHGKGYAVEFEFAA